MRCFGEFWHILSRSTQAKTNFNSNMFSFFFFLRNWSQKWWRFCCPLHDIGKSFKKKLIASEPNIEFGFIDCISINIRTNLWTHLISNMLFYRNDEVKQTCWLLHYQHIIIQYPKWEWDRGKRSTTRWKMRMYTHTHTHRSIR